ncbi:hypothetical protein HDV57DRAFT_490577 [Trichoderma longibrachiatum]
MTSRTRGFCFLLVLEKNLEVLGRISLYKLRLLRNLPYMQDLPQALLPVFLMSTHFISTCSAFWYHVRANNHIGNRSELKLTNSIFIWRLMVNHTLLLQLLIRIPFPTYNTLGS